MSFDILHMRGVYRNHRADAMVCMIADHCKAHKALDKAIDACYGKKGFKSEPERLEFLFERYQEYIVKK